MPYTHIQWPEGLDEATFLRDYWQQKPLLIRQALPDFDTPLPADELAGLSLEPDTTPRLVLRDVNGAYHLEHGPFEAERFESLTGNDWSLLVTDIEKHVPEMASYLCPFAFLPSWRIDDLMISYAPVGASVGAHTDEYDVFLLQASGVREWSIDASPSDDLETDDSSDLAILSTFKPSDTWQLQPGDLLYLPPGIPHHGIAMEDPCTTWSIGFRAPAIPDYVMRVAEMICEHLPAKRYVDGALAPAVPGELTDAALDRFATLWRDAVNLDDSTLATLTGRFLTESVQQAGAGIGSDSDSDSDSSIRSGIDGRTLPAGSAPNAPGHLRLAPFSRAAWLAIEDNTEAVRLFVDGEVHNSSRKLAMALCTLDHSLDAESREWSRSDRELLFLLLDNGSLTGEP